MKHLLWVIGICGWLVFSFTFAGAQSVDVLRDVADPNTKLFSDGKTDVAAYVNSVLVSKTGCFGEDNVYMQVKLDDCGFPTSVRALNGKKDCMKKSMEDIIKHIRWNVSVAKPGQIIFAVKVKIDSTDGKSGAYNAVPEPNGWTAIKQQVTQSRSGCVGGPKPADPAAKPDNLAGNNAGNAGAGNNAGANPNPAQTPSQPANNNAGGGGSQPQPNNTPPLGAPKTPINAKTVDTTGLKSKMIPVELPDPRYISQGNKFPDKTHEKSILNERGPQFEKPRFVDGESGMGIYIKTMFRRFNYCGLAMAHSEVTVEPDGTVSSYRIFRTNNDKVQSLTPYIIGSLRFLPVQRRTIFYFQFQTDVDCDGFPRNPVDKTKFYFNAPDKAPRSPQEGGGSSKLPSGDGDVLKSDK